MKEDTSDEESDYGNGFQNLGYFAESFLDPIDSVGPILQVGQDGVNQTLKTVSTPSIGYVRIKIH